MPCHSSNAITGACGHAALPRLAGDITALFKQEEGSFLSYPVPWDHAVHWAWQYLGSRHQGAWGQEGGEQEHQLPLALALLSIAAMQGTGASGWIQPPKKCTRDSCSLWYLGFLTLPVSLYLSLICCWSSDESLSIYFSLDFLLFIWAFGGGFVATRKKQKRKNLPD